MRKQRIESKKAEPKKTGYISSVTEMKDALRFKEIIMTFGEKLFALRTKKV